MTARIFIDGEAGTITEHTWTAADFGLPPCEVSPLRVESPEESASMIRGVFQGQAGPARDVVVANTAAALVAYGETTDLAEAARQAEAAIDQGRPTDQLAALVEVSGRLAG